MSKEGKFETVAEHCIRMDCVYRMIFDRKNTPFCAYILIEKQPRGCSISQCTRYRTGIKRAVMTSGATIDWLVEEEEQ